MICEDGNDGIFVILINYFYIILFRILVFLLLGFYFKKILYDRFFFLKLMFIFEFLIFFNIFFFIYENYRICGCRINIIRLIV